MIETFPVQEFFSAKICSEGLSFTTGLCYKVLARISNDSENLGKVAFSAECILHTNRVFDEHNAVVWGVEYSHAVKEVPVTSKEAFVSCRTHEKRVSVFIYFLKNRQVV